MNNLCLLSLYLVASFTSTFASPTLITRPSNAYDVVIVGGGTAGLALGSRLSEDPSTQVLVIEAGPLLSGADEFSTLLIPGEVFAQQSAIGQRFDWNITSAPNALLNGRTFPVFTRRIVGGGSALNAMFFARGTKRDYDDWARWIGDAGWNFGSLLKYFKRSETFTPATKENAREFGVRWEPGMHGNDGPVSSSYPPWLWKSSKYLRDAMVGMGIPETKDGAADGNAVGAMWAPGSIKPREWVRSYSKNAYYDPVARRKNWHLLAGHTVTKILFHGNAAVGVEYVAGTGPERKAVRARKQVVLSAGAIHSPRLLQLSGVGNKRSLTRLQIPVIADLPGVGQNHQDHSQVAMSYSQTWPPYYDVSTLLLNATAQQQARELYLAKREGPYTSNVGNFAGMISVPMAVPERYQALISGASKEDPAKYLPEDTHPSVVEGYRQQVKLLLAALGTNESAAYEQAHTIAAMQHPLSRGYVTIASSDPFQHPEVNWRTISHPFDAKLAVEAVRLIRRIYDRPELALSNPVEMTPGRNVSSDEEIIGYLKESGLTPSWSHHSGTCQMGPIKWGGVVDGRLRVYGVKNLRIVDASVFPFLVGSHTQASVYAVAEKAADIIKEELR